jgi:orotidine-5'-phosphate decarboxylase
VAFPVRARERIIAALDVPGPAAAAALAARLAGHVGVYKVGLELFVAHGRAAVDAVRPFGLPIFLDLKLHDIPQTVEAAARGAGTLGAALVTVHASGGTAMIAAARSGLSAGAQKAGVPTPKLLAVTVLTSLAPDDLHALGFSGSPAQTALRLARLAMKAGADGLVCSPEEVAEIRHELGPDPLIVVPGVRPEGMSVGDQRRTGTPRAAIDAGASHVVVGRALRDAPDPAAAADAIAAAIDAR